MGIYGEELRGGAGTDLTDDQNGGGILVEGEEWGQR